MEPSDQSDGGVDLKEPGYERGLALAGIVIVGVLIAIQVGLQFAGYGGQIGSILLLGVLLGLGVRSRARWRKGEIGSPLFAWFLTFLYGSFIPLLLGFSATLRAEQTVQDIAGGVVLLLLLCIGIGVLGTVLVSRASDRRTDRAGIAPAVAAVPMEIPPPPVDLLDG